MKVNVPAAAIELKAAFDADRLLDWAPEHWPVAPDWQPTVAGFLRSEPAQKLGKFIQERMKQGAVVYPPRPFFALQLTPLEHVKVVILGQDPYHGPGQAHGLAFSVKGATAVPPSLRNIFKELAREATEAGQIRQISQIIDEAAPVLSGNKSAAKRRQISSNGLLEAWARQGVLLLNTCLTVEHGQPASHSKLGWETLTDLIIQTVAASKNPVVFMLWGAHAQAKRGLLINPAARPAGGALAAPRLVLSANHPSPLSALRPPAPFIGCGHFGAANAFLCAHGLEPIAWV